MTMTRFEVLKFDEVDSQHDLFVTGCFGDVNGKRIPVRLGFDIRMPVGVGILSEADGRLFVDVEVDPIQAELHAAVGCMCLEYGQSIHGAFKEVRKANLTEIALVSANQKVR